MKRTLLTLGAIVTLAIALGFIDSKVNGQSPVAPASSPSLGSTASPSPFTFGCPNDGTTGTTAGLVVKLSAANTCINETTGDANASSANGAAIGVCVTGCGTTGSAQIAPLGPVVPCTFDGATTFGHMALLSSTTGGQCKDSGANTINAGAGNSRYVFGRILDTGAAGNHNVALSYGDNPLTWNTLVNVNSQLAFGNFAGGMLLRQASGSAGTGFMLGGAASTSPCLADSGALLKIQQAGASGCASDTDFSARLYAQTVGTAIASAATIAPVAPVTHITGTTLITTITAPTIFATSGYGGCITLIPDGLWTLGTSGNIATAVTASVNQAVNLCYDNGTSKWYPIPAAPAFDPTQYTFIEEFERLIANTAPIVIGTHGWSTTNTLGNGWNSFNPTAGTLAHPSVFQYATIGTAAGDGGASWPQAGGQGNLLGAIAGASGGTWTSYIVFQLPATANVDMRVGFTDNTQAAALAPSNGIFVRYLSSTDTNFVFENRSGGVATTSTTNSIAVNTGWNCLKLSSTGTSGSIGFQIGATCASLGTQTTVAGAPTATNLTPAIVLASDTVAGVRNLNMDLFYFNSTSIGR